MTGIFLIFFSKYSLDKDYPYKYLEGALLTALVDTINEVFLWQNVSFCLSDKDVYTFM